MVDNEYAGLSGDGEDHFVVEFESPAAFEESGGDKGGNFIVQLCFEGLGQSLVEWEIVTQVVAPLRLKDDGGRGCA